MQGLMMQWPLVLTHFLERARRLHHARPIASREAAGVFHYTYGDWAARVDRPVRLEQQQSTPISFSLIPACCFFQLHRRRYVRLK